MCVGGKQGGSVRDERGYEITEWLSGLCKHVHGGDRVHRGLSEQKWRTSVPAAIAQSVILNEMGAIIARLRQVTCFSIWIDACCTAGGVHTHPGITATSLQQSTSQMVILVFAKVPQRHHHSVIVRIWRRFPAAFGTEEEVTFVCVHHVPPCATFSLLINYCLPPRFAIPVKESKKCRRANWTNNATCVPLITEAATPNNIIYYPERTSPLFIQQANTNVPAFSQCSSLTSALCLLFIMAAVMQSRARMHANKRPYTSCSPSVSHCFRCVPFLSPIVTPTPTLEGFKGSSCEDGMFWLRLFNTCF